MSATLFLLAALAAAPPATPHESFATPEQAAQALVAAAEKFDVEQLKKILGPDGIDLVVTEDAVMGKNQSTAFAAVAKEKMRVEKDAKNPNRATLIVGSEDWPMPIPIVQAKGRWSFDSKAGRQEILFRRIGRNELDAIEICRGYCDAQHEYASERHDGAVINQYAQRLISTAGKRDGLAWQTAAGTWEGPIGEGIAHVIAEGYTSKSQPYHGYYFKVLKGQGPAAPMGAIDYVVKGAMIGGFALVAAPADYRVTGVKTFIVNESGVVHEKDLGPTSVEQFKAMTIYNPDKTWKPVHED
jgi:hypothetical protein